jgi:RNA polymerase sigma-70 factor (sigma-E family)
MVMMASMAVRRDPLEPAAGPVAGSSGLTDGLGQASNVVAFPVDHRQALRELYVEHYTSLVRMACLLLDRKEAAEEVVQEAFVRLDRSWHRVQDPSALPAYLRSTVMNLARSRLRRRLVARNYPPNPSPDAPAADEAVVVREEQQQVIEALRSLPDRQRECLVLRYYQDLPEAEIASTLGISSGSVKTHIHRGMVALSRQLEALA